MALREVTSDSKYRWFSRPHPSQPETGKLFVENGFEDIPASIPVKEAYALADVIIHDYSSMEFSEYSGIVSLCLPADPPYPDYYKPLLGDQQIIKTPEHFLEIIRDIEPGYKPGASVTKAMAAEGEDALDRISKVVTEITNLK